MVAGEIVRGARRRHGVSQRSLARRARTSQAHIARIESGAVDPALATLDRLLAVMGERLDIHTVPGPGALPNQSPADHAADLELTSGQRIEQAAELSYALTAIAPSSSP